MPIKNHNPIFIHSLFRSGSTWLFERFRTSPAMYWCYQEPYHEALITLNTNPEALLSFSETTVRALRHPHMKAPYFQEFYAIRDELKGQFDKKISYDSFFDPLVCPAFEPYTAALILNARSRPLLQCCRSFGRVSFLKTTFPGTHILLWRDPVSQWLSYQINDYFDIVGLSILNAINPPEIIRLLRSEIGLNEVRAENFYEEYSTRLKFPMDSKQRYQIFFALWLYHMIHNFPLCDMDINVDQLTQDAEYTEYKKAELNNLGIADVNIAQCTMPATVLSKADEGYFNALENWVVDLFRQAGYAADTLEQALQQRQVQRPKPKYHKKSLVESASRARVMAYRYADRLSEALEENNQLRAQLNALENK